MRCAIEEYKTNQISIRAAAKKYCIPSTTLYCKARGVRPIERKMGPLTKQQFFDCVADYVRCQPENPFKEGRPKEKWFRRFCARHPSISMRVAQNISRARAAVTEENLRKWFEDVQKFCETNSCIEALSDPKRVYNLDETAFFLSPEVGKVIAKKGVKTVYNISKNCDKQCTTVLMGGNAAGQLVPKQKTSHKMSPNICRKTGALVSRITLIQGKSFIGFNTGFSQTGRSDSGWMTAVTFLEYLKQIFYPFLCEQGIDFPVILFVDGHTSHFSIETSEFCAEKKIVVVALFPNSTHLLQPMDVAVFGPLKRSWRAAVHQWKYKNHNFKTLTKEHFAGLLHNVIEKHIKPEYLQSGFRTSGLFPFNPDGIDYTKLVGNNSKQRNDEDDFEAEKRETERKKFAVGFECMRAVLSDAKEIDFFEFYSSDNSKPWGGAIEDTTAYYIWREMLQRSRDTEITSMMEENEQDENSNEADNLGNELFTEEEIHNWNEFQEPNIEYFDSFEENSEIEDHSTVDRDRQEVTSAGSEVPVVPIDETSNFTTQRTEPDVSLPELYNLPTVDAPCPVKDVFLQCLKPPKQKFSVPKIKGKISLHFTSANESHYISCIDFSSDTTVVSGKWHREYIQKQKQKHQLTAERRLQRQKAKKSAESKAETEPRQSARPKTSKFLFPNPPFCDDADDTNDDSDFELNKKKKTKSTKKSRKLLMPRKPLSPYETPNLDTSFSSGTSFSPEPKKRCPS